MKVNSSRVSKFQKTNQLNINENVCIDGDKHFEKLNIKNCIN